MLFLTHDPTGPGTRIGNLDLQSIDDLAAMPFRLLDDFDRSLRKAGQMLIETDEALTLWAGGRTHVQDAHREGPFVPDLAEGPVRAMLGAVAPLRALLVVGQGRAQCHQLALTDDEGKTQARAALTILRPAGDGSPVTIAALQGLRGYDGALRALRSHLQGPDGGHLGTLSDLSDLMFPRTAAYRAKPVIAIAETDRAWRAATDIIAAHLAVARQNEPGIIADHDTEFLHDYRVALRKTRSVVSLFRGVYASDQTEQLKRSLSDLMAPTGRLRDLDVYLLAREDYFAMLPPALHEGLALMFDMLAQERARAHARISDLLGSAEYKASIAQLQRLLDTAPGPQPGPRSDDPVGTYARRLIWKRYRKLSRLAARITDDTCDARIHDLRIACKKLRYLMEFFAPLFPAPDIKALLKPLKRLQDNLGLFNDYSVQQTALRRFMDKHDPVRHSQDLILAQSVGALIALLHARQATERARVMSSFAQFDAPPTRAMFRTLFDGKETRR